MNLLNLIIDVFVTELLLPLGKTNSIANDWCFLLEQYSIPVMAAERISFSSMRFQ
jgi:hypothetical protein